MYLGAFINFLNTMAPSITEFDVESLCEFCCWSAEPVGGDQGAVRSPFCLFKCLDTMEVTVPSGGKRGDMVFRDTSGDRVGVNWYVCFFPSVTRTNLYHATFINNR